MRNRAFTRWTLAATVALSMVVLATLSSPAGAAGTGLGHWRGKTSQNIQLRFDVLKSNTGLIVEPGLIEATGVCSADGSQIGVGVFFSGFHLKVVHHQFGIKKNFPDFAFAFGGTIQGSAAAGSLFIAFPAFTRDLGLQSCSSGNDVTWKAHPPAQSVAAGPAVPRQMTISITRSNSGHISYTISRG